MEEEMFEEEWKEIEGWPEYKISNLGRVYSVRYNRFMKGKKNTTGYLQIHLSVNWRQYYACIHRLVADYFVDGYFEGAEANHKDGIKTNNAAWNLEWCTRSENILHAYRIGLNQPSGGRPKTVVRIIETNEVFSSASECAKYIGGSRSNISACLRGERMQHLGYHFEYAD